jgi:hypothetical protein
MNTRLYCITAEVTIMGNIHPEVRHVFIAEVDSEKAFHNLSGKRVKLGELSVFEREALIQETLIDATCDFLGARNILVPPFGATVDPKLLRGGSVPNKQPEWETDGIKLWHCGESKHAG